MNALPPARVLLPAVAAAALMSIIVWMISAWPVPVRVAVGGLVYGVALTALGGLPGGLERWLPASIAPARNLP